MALLPLFQPLMALVLWSFVMWAWLYATRIPAIARAKLEFDPTMTREQLSARLPAYVRWPADNYNNLFEQPVLFYAVLLTLAFLNAGDAVNVGLAWAYVGLRVVHSLVHALVNLITLRFAVFMVASVVLLILTLRTAALVFLGTA